MKKFGNHQLTLREVAKIVPLLVVRPLRLRGNSKLYGYSILIPFSMPNIIYYNKFAQMDVKNFYLTIYSSAGLICVLLIPAIQAYNVRNHRYKLNDLMS